MPRVPRNRLLTDAQVAEIRAWDGQRRALGTMKSKARELGVSPALVKRICTDQTYREGVNSVTLVSAPFALVQRYTGDMIPYENGVTMDIVEGSFVSASDYDRLLMQLVRERQARWRAGGSHVG